MAAEDPIIVFSDIHSNLEAFQAVLADLHHVRFSRLICLGDIVGYAASPKQCLELVRSLDCEVLKGNHDFAVVDNPTMLEMRGAAALSIQYARKQLSLPEAQFLSQLPMTAEWPECQFVHASLNQPEAWTYLVHEPEIREHFKSQTHHIAFCGHTHIPAVVWLTPNDDLKLLGRSGRIELPMEGKILINAGSVGQPRDHCPDACYVIFDSSSCAAEFRRVKYDIASAQRRISEAKLPKITGDRLLSGR